MDRSQDLTSCLEAHGLRIGAAVLVALAGTTSDGDAHAQSSLDMVEHILGTSNVNAITGHGRMAVGVSRDGDVSVLSWPNPSFCDPLGNISSNAIDARDQPRFGAPEGAGIFLGWPTISMYTTSPGRTWR